MTEQKIPGSEGNTQMMSEAVAVMTPAHLHEHDWHLVSVENETGSVSVSEFACSGCPDVLFR